MRDTSKIRIFLISLLLITFTACSDKGTNNNANDRIQSLVGTSWKLVGFVDAETNVIFEKPNDLFKSINNPLTLEFKENNILNGTGSSKYVPLYGSYELDINNKFKSIKFWQMTYIYEHPFVETFIENINNSTSFSVTSENLKMYYENGSKYLLFDKK